MRIAFGHKARTGKDAAAKYMQSKYGGHILRFASPVYDIHNFILQRLDIPIIKNPKLLQFLGEGLKEVFEDNALWAKELDRELAQYCDTNIFIPDLRFKCEFQMLKDRGFTTVKINRSNRPIDRDPNHKSEIDLDDITFDYVIDNDKTLDEFYLKLEQISQ